MSEFAPGPTGPAPSESSPSHRESSSPSPSPAEPERDFSNMRFERPSPHNTVELMQAEAETKHYNDLQSSMATAEDMGDVLKVTQDGMSGKSQRDESLDRLTYMRHGHAAYTDDTRHDQPDFDSRGPQFERDMGDPRGKGR